MYSSDPTPKEICKTLAERHKILRKTLKMSQAEMAERSGVSLGSLKRFESSGRISLDSLLRLANIAGRLKDFENVFTLGKDMSQIERLFTKNNVE